MGGGAFALRALYVRLSLERFSSARLIDRARLASESRVVRGGGVSCQMTH